MVGFKLAWFHGRLFQKLFEILVVGPRIFAFVYSFALHIIYTQTNYRYIQFQFA